METRKGYTESPESPPSLRPFAIGKKQVNRDRSWSQCVYNI